MTINTTTTVAAAIATTINTDFTYKDTGILPSDRPWPRLKNFIIFSCHARSGSRESKHVVSCLDSKVT